MKCLLTALTLFLPSVLHAQTSCYPYSVFSAALSEKHKESPRVRALRGETHVLEIWAAEDGKWTAIVVHPNGIACVVMAGEAFIAMQAEPAGVEG